MKKKDNGYKPSIFIASSGKSKPIADAVKLNLDKEADIDIWTENIFKLNEGTLETLMNRASYYDYFIAVFAADDNAILDKKQKGFTRDNVIFEFGLFLGRIGLDRTFFILEDGAELFSDWKGVTVTTFTQRDNLVSALGSSCIKIREKIKIAEDNLFSFTILPSTSLAIGYYNNFLKPVLDALQDQSTIEIIEKDKGGNVIKKMEQELRNHFPTIEIRVPRKLASLQREIINIQTKDYKQIILNAKARPFPFYVQGEFNEESKISLFDIPTTLYASYLTLKQFFSPQFLAIENNEQKLIDKEIRNFEKTLSKLIPDVIEHKFYRFSIY